MADRAQHRVQAGARLIVPFGPRKMTGVVLRAHDEPPSMAVKDAFRLIDATGTSLSVNPKSVHRRAKELEPVDLFWLEDVTPGENQEILKLVRQHRSQ